MYQVFSSVLSKSYEVSYSAVRVDVKLKMDQWTEQAALASVNCLARFSISGAASTLPTLYRE